MPTQANRLLCLAASALLTFVSLQGLALYAQQSRDTAIARHLAERPMALAAPATAALK